MGLARIDWAVPASTASDSMISENPWGALGGCLCDIVLAIALEPLRKVTYMVPGD